MPDLTKTLLYPQIRAVDLEIAGGQLVPGAPNQAYASNDTLVNALSLGNLSYAPEQFQQRPIPEPQRGYNFQVQLPSFSGVPMPIVEGIDPQLIEATSPGSEPIGGRHAFTAGTYDAPPLTLIMYHNQRDGTSETNGHDALNYINYWKAMVQNADGTYNYPNDYLRDIYFHFKDVDLQIGYTLWYRRCFPLSADRVQMRYTQSTRTAIAVTFSVERIKPLPLSGGQQRTVTDYQSVQAPQSMGVQFLEM